MDPQTLPMGRTTPVSPFVRSLGAAGWLVAFYPQFSTTSSRCSSANPKLQSPRDFTLLLALAGGKGWEQRWWLGMGSGGIIPTPSAARPWSLSVPPKHRHCVPHG